MRDPRRRKRLCRFGNPPGAYVLANKAKLAGWAYGVTFADLATTSRGTAILLFASRREATDAVRNRKVSSGIRWVPVRLRLGLVL